MTGNVSSSNIVASQPQYVLVAQALVQDIGVGRFPVGSLLPPEHELCRLFGVSRHTIREAVRRLEERGMVVRQRGVGTSVRANRSDVRFVQSATSITDLQRYVEDTRLVTEEVSEVIADEALAKMFECPAGQRWVRVVGLRYAGQEKAPIALTSVYINAAYGRIQKLVGTLKVPVYTMLEREFGLTIVEVRQQISAKSISAAEARKLGVRARSPGLLVLRRYVADNGQMLEVAVNLHPADRFSYSSSLRLQIAAKKPVAL